MFKFAIKLKNKFNLVVLNLTLKFKGYKNVFE